MLEKMKRIMRRVGIIGALGSIVIIGLIIFQKKDAQISPSPTPTPSLSEIPVTFPQTETIEVAGVTIQNVYRDAKRVTRNNDVVFRETAAYQIIYLPSFQKFLISILQSPFEENRKQAENALLTTLGIAKSDACMLTVEITTPASTNPSYAGKRLPLSFCID